jgi:hypothetical protein
MAAGDLGQRTACIQPFERIGASGFEQTKLCDRRVSGSDDQRLADQIGDAHGDCTGGHGLPSHGAGSSQRERASKDRETTQKFAFRFGEELEAPVERRAQRAMPRQCGATRRIRSIDRPSRGLLLRIGLKPTRVLRLETLRKRIG